MNCTSIKDENFKPLSFCTNLEYVRLAGTKVQNVCVFKNCQKKYAHNEPKFGMCNALEEPDNIWNKKDSGYFLLLHLNSIN